MIKMLMDYMDHDTIYLHALKCWRYG